MAVIADLERIRIDVDHGEKNNRWVQILCVVVSGTSHCVSSMRREPVFIITVTYNLLSVIDVEFCRDQAILY